MTDPKLARFALLVDENTSIRISGHDILSVSFDTTTNVLELAVKRWNDDQAATRQQM